MFGPLRYIFEGGNSRRLFTALESIAVNQNLVHKSKKAVQQSVLVVPFSDKFLITLISTPFPRRPKVGALDGGL
jgi:hypothetical protein